MSAKIFPLAQTRCLDHLVETGSDCVSGDAVQKSA